MHLHRTATREGMDQEKPLILKKIVFKVHRGDGWAWPLQRTAFRDVCGHPGHQQLVGSSYLMLGCYSLEAAPQLEHTDMNWPDMQFKLKGQSVSHSPKFIHCPIWVLPIIYVQHLSSIHQRKKYCTRQKRDLLTRLLPRTLAQPQANVIPKVQIP